MLSARSNRRIYVETTVRGDLPTLWARSQDPRQHRRWDLRFTTIEPAAPGQLRHAVRVLPGVEVPDLDAERRADGCAGSLLRFRSPHLLSLLRAESTGEAPSHTARDYEVRWGIAGRAADRAFRPLMGWRTAWAFDRLRLWVERGITPEQALRNALADAGVRVAAVGLAAARCGRVAAVATALVVVLLPPSPLTPAARRCLRRPRRASGA
ncbi:hypothetical protein ACQEVB_37970 [Pseudonocardia sp. CA-107938]|uniref:hypothetical protein n=1 Tax=Pseudonocardia sp. CA-107938 TaxID=3240021 RepID=UPI003D902269